MKLVAGLCGSKKGQEDPLVAVVPDSDQRLKTNRTKLYGPVIILLCLLLVGLVLFFFLLFPRPIGVANVAVKSSYVFFDEEKHVVYLTITSTMDITNNNYFPIYVTNITAQVQFAKTEIGKAQITNCVRIIPLHQTQVDFTVPTILGDDMTYMFDYCTLATIKVHNIAVLMQVIVTTSYFGLEEQAFQESYQYVDCGANTTALPPSALTPTRTDPPSRRPGLTRPHVDQD